MVAGADRGRGDALEGRSGSKVAKARARARKIENEAKAARARLKRAQTAENTVKELRGQLDEAMEVEEASRRRARRLARTSRRPSWPAEAMARREAAGISDRVEQGPREPRSARRRSPSLVDSADCKAASSASV